MKAALQLFFMLVPMGIFGATYYSQGFGDPADLDYWNTSRLAGVNAGAGEPSNFSTNNDVFVIQDQHTMTTTSAWSLTGSDMILQIENGGTLQANHAVSINSTGTIQIDNGGTYYHNFSGENIYGGTESFAITSTVEVQTIPNDPWEPHTSGPSQDMVFGHLIINYSSGGNMRLGIGNHDTAHVHGNLTIKQTGSGELNFHNGSNTKTLKIYGDFNLEGGEFVARSSASSIFRTFPNLKIKGNVNLTGGTWDHRGFSMEVCIIGVNNTSTITHNGATLTQDAINGIEWTIVENCSAALGSNLELGNNGSTNDRYLRVMQNASFDFGDYYIHGAGGIISLEESTLTIRSADGIATTTTAGNIRVASSKRHIMSATNFIYGGSSGQVTGSGLNDLSLAVNITSSIHNGDVIIANTSGTVTFTEDLQVNTAFTLTVNEGAELSFPSGVSISSTSGSPSVQINGTVKVEDGSGFQSASTGGTHAFQGLSITQGSTATVNYNLSGNQSVPAGTYNNLVLSGSGTKTFAGNTTISGNFTVTGATASLPTSLEFNGTSTQTISGLDFGSSNVTFSGGGDKNLDGNTTFNGNITFSNGDVGLGNHNVTLGSSAAVSGAGANAYFKINGSGRLIQTISSGTDYEFPVGQNPYLPVTVSCASCSGEEISVGVSPGIYTNPETQSQTFGDAGHSNYVDQTWDLTTNGINDVTVELQWNSSDQTPNPGSNNTNNSVAMGVWEDNVSSSWDPGSVSNAGVSGDIYTISRTFGTLNNGTHYLAVGSASTPLPVELTYFDYACQGNAILFNWQTASELNNSHFELEGSMDGISFNALGRIDGNGTSYSTRDYSYQAAGSLPFKYFRLAQYDYDGSLEYSNTLSISCQEQQNNVVIHGRQLSFSQPTDVQVIDVSGRLVFSQKKVTQVNLHHLMSGMYLVHANGTTQRFMVR